MNERAETMPPPPQDVPVGYVPPPPRRKLAPIVPQESVAGRALILEKGSVRWQGPMATLEADEDIRRAYLTV